jgi:hypothetical protein
LERHAKFILEAPNDPALLTLLAAIEIDGERKSVRQRNLCTDPRSVLGKVYNRATSLADNIRENTAEAIEAFPRRFSALSKHCFFILRAP